MEFLPITKHRIIRVYDHGSCQTIADQLVAEELLRIVVNGDLLISLACSPEYITHLAVGYLLSEGLVQSPEDILNINVVPPLTVEVETRGPLDRQSLNKINTCMGRSSAAQPSPLPISCPVPWKPDHILNLIKELDDSSVTFRRTGGVHSAALGAQTGTLVRYEDIGRHNAVDKVMGFAFLERIPLHDKCLLLSGRIASEILLKVARLGIPMIISRSAPTFKAVEMADQLGITIVGFARGQKFNLYAHDHRVDLD